MGRVAAFFDVDRTLLPGISSEQIFIPYLVRRRKLGLLSVLYTLWFAGRSPRDFFKHGKAVYKAYVHRREVEELRKLAHDCFEERIKPRLSSDGLERARWHHDQGHLVVLLTGSPRFLIDPLAELVEAHHVIACDMQVRKGRYVGRMSSLYPRGKNKAILAVAFAEEHGIDLDLSYGYADHHTDTHFLALFGHAVAVNPDERLRAIAQQHQWAIESFA